MLKLTLVFGFLFSPLCVGASTGDRSFFGIDLGAYGENLKARYSSGANNQKEVSRIVAVTRFRWGIHLGKSFHLIPSWAIVLPWQSGVDGSTKMFSSHLNLDLSLPIAHFFRFRVGPGLFWNFHLSREQSVELNNGTSTSTFYLPGYALSSFQFTVDAALEFRFSRVICLSFDLITTNFGEKNRRDFNGFITLGLIL